MIIWDMQTLAVYSSGNWQDYVAVQVDLSANLLLELPEAFSNLHNLKVHILSTAVFFCS